MTNHPAGGARILDAALPQFAERGYENTTLDAVGAAAGTDRAGVELLFPTKATLFAALVDRELERLRAQVADAVPAEATGQSVGLAVGRALDALFARIRASTASWRLLLLADFGSFGEREAREHLREVLRTRLRWLVASAAPIPPQDRRLVSEMLALMLASMLEINLAALLAGDRITPPALVERALDRLFAGRWD